jgi:UDP-N-acetylmuramoyl-L-alanyl-D-glutamate--2,6-diaminopimelate ligase
MTVIGVTGTKGKTTTSNILFEVLSQKYTVGLITTANIKIGKEERLNPWHMTMPGRALIQKLLSEMKRKGVTHVIIETTSEGLKQKRHVGIYYDIALFTNLSPEHLPSHNYSYDEYRKAKEVLFMSLNKAKKKVVKKSTIVVNGDDKESVHFLKYKAHEKVSYGLESVQDVVANHLHQKDGFLSFEVKGKKFAMNTFGKYSVYNALPAIIIAESLSVSLEQITFALSHLPQIPGRMEKIDEGQDFLALVDYAHEKLSMTRLAETVRELQEEGVVRKWIVLLGAEGGGRDTRKRKDMGEIVGAYADKIVISDTDPYEEDEMKIAKEIAGYIEEKGRKEGDDYVIVLNRREGIQKALSLAESGDIVTITGNGSQQFYHLKGEKVPHDDRVVVREILQSMGYSKNKKV